MPSILFQQSEQKQGMYAEINGNEIKLYGRIWQGDAAYILRDISKLLNNSANNLTIHLHTPGGSVIDGNLIYNELVKAKANISIVIDGLAASMGSILMLSGRHVSIAENAFIMVHAPSGYQEGNAKDFEGTAKVLRAMESSFLKKLSAKTSKKPEDIKDWMVGDNWFSADEALKEGLVDEIIDPVMEHSDMSAYKDINMCAQLFEAVDKRNIPLDPQPPTNQKPDNMKIDAKAISALGLKADASETEINEAILAVASKNEGLTKKLSDKESEIAAEAKAKREKLINDAVAAGKIMATEKEQYLKDAEANYELVERMLAKTAGKGSLSEEVVPSPEASADGRDKWNYTDWRKKDPAALIEMKTKDPKRYAALYASR